MLDPIWLRMASKSAPRDFRRVPRGFQEAPRGSKKRSKRPQGDLQAAKTHPRALQEGSRNGLGMIFGTIWKHFLQMLDCYASRLAASCQQDGGRRHGAKPLRSGHGASAPLLPYPAGGFEKEGSFARIAKADTLTSKL